MTPDTSDYGPDRQAEVYLSGMLEDEPPEFPASDEDLVERAREELGEDDVSVVLENPLADLDLTVGLSGCASLEAIARSTIRRAGR